jgi:large subunit ribosomal protein L23Ae
MTSTTKPKTTTAAKKAEPKKTQTKAKEPAAATEKAATKEKPVRKSKKVDPLKRANDAKVSKESQKQKALAKIKTLLKKGKRPSARKIWHNTQFRRPRTLQLHKAPKYARHSVPQSKALDRYQILKYPLTAGEGVLKLIEEQNTIIFMTDLHSSKKQIKQAFEKMYDTKVELVRTQIRPTGDKKAFIKIPKDIEAVELATKIGDEEKILVLPRIAQGRANTEEEEW